MMARRADHSKEELAKLVIGAAEAMIAAKGVEQLSARALGREIGYTAGTLYHHFRDLDDIVTQVNARTLAGLADAFHAATPSTDPKQMLHNYADAFLGFIRQKRNLWNALFEFRRQPGIDVPSWYVDAIAGLIRIIAKCFRDIRPDLDERIAAQSGQLVFASIHSVSSLESSGRLQLIMDRDIGKVVHELVDTHIVAFSNKK
jgi:AcrR family transcriptional regulator